ncbi:UNVERIFIED_CONTAM: hypothetical protein GTU68_032119 [Idotea baltica]|nr:hypothetical protein [Idotea baltica]
MIYTTSSSGIGPADGSKLTRNLGWFGPAGRRLSIQT